MVINQTNMNYIKLPPPNNNNKIFLLFAITFSIWTNIRISKPK